MFRSLTCSHPAGGRHSIAAARFGLSVLLIPALTNKKAGARNAPASVMFSPLTDYGEEMM